MYCTLCELEQGYNNNYYYCYAEHLRFPFEEFYTDIALLKCPSVVSKVSVVCLREVFIL